MNETTARCLQEQGFSTTIVERFWGKVFILPYDRGCWIWTASTDHNGYGVIGRGSKYGGMASAHRVSWIIHNGFLPKGEPLLHVCDNPLCVRPDHLRRGSQRENVRDMIQKGRMPRGEQRGHAKLTWKSVDEIRSLFSSGVEQKVIAERFAVCQQTVSEICTNQKWKVEFHPAD